jgi:hypothetical protein
MFFFGHRFGFLPWHNCQFEVLPMSLEDLLPMSSDHTLSGESGRGWVGLFRLKLP